MSHIILLHQSHERLFLIYRFPYIQTLRNLFILPLVLGIVWAVAYKKMYKMKLKYRIYAACGENMFQNIFSRRQFFIDKSKMISYAYQAFLIIRYRY